MHCVILAGGSGTRFWPYSRINRPKQLLNIIGDQSMLQITVDRLKKLRSTKEIYIITRKELHDTIASEIKGIDPKNIVIEPSGKNTAPAIGLMALKITEYEPEAIMGVFPADHLIVGHHDFENTIDQAGLIAKKNSGLITIGIDPTHASTEYGYIQFEQVKDKKDLSGYKVKTFAEKPHAKLAKRFLTSGDFLWNAGIFVWDTNTLLSSMKMHMPELYEYLREIKKCIQKDKPFDHVWRNIPPESIDYGLMEKSDDIFVIPGKFKWSDLGSWNALYDVLPKSKGENVVHGAGMVLSGENNLVHSNGRFTAIVGADNLAVINTEDATLVVPKEKVEHIKDLVSLLKKEGHENLL